MNSYQDIKAKIAELEAEAQKLLKTERREAIALVKSKIAEFALSVQDLGLIVTGQRAARKSAGKAKKAGKRGGKVKVKSKVKPKYHHPETGDTWSGRGRPPRWLVALEAEGKSRDQFLVG